MDGLHSLLQVGHQHIARSCWLMCSTDSRAARRRAACCNVQHLQGAEAAALNPVIIEFGRGQERLGPGCKAALVSVANALSKQLTRNADKHRLFSGQAHMPCRSPTIRQAAATSGMASMHARHSTHPVKSSRDRVGVVHPTSPGCLLGSGTLHGSTCNATLGASVQVCLMLAGLSSVAELWSAAEL